MYPRILVPLDGSETSLRGLDEAVRIALRDRAALRRVHVINRFRRTTGFASPASYSELVPTMKEAGEQLLRQGRERAERSGVKAETRLISSLTGGLSELVATEAADWNADLIVIGTHGRRGIERNLWGSDAEQVMRVANIPVLLVQAPQGDGDDRTRP